MCVVTTAVPQSSGRAGRGSGRRRNTTCEYRFFTEFQSHDAEFDYLKSLEIEEKINQIRWCKSSNSALFLLSTNGSQGASLPRRVIPPYAVRALVLADKTIKLWKVFEKKLKVVSQMNLPRGRYGKPVNVSSLKIPTLTCRDTAVCATPRRVYANAHAYHVNSISPCSDGETFLSADDLRINLWNMNNSQISFNIVDIKPENMEELTEVITASCFHPKSCNLFIYSSSRGAIKLADMRSAALCDSHSKSTCCCVVPLVAPCRSRCFLLQSSNRLRIRSQRRSSRRSLRQYQTANSLQKAITLSHGII